MTLKDKPWWAYDNAGGYKNKLFTECPYCFELDSMGVEARKLHNNQILEVKKCKHKPCQREYHVWTGSLWYISYQIVDIIKKQELTEKDYKYYVRYCYEKYNIANNISILNNLIKQDNLMCLDKQHGDIVGFVKSLTYHSNTGYEAIVNLTTTHAGFTTNKYYKDPDPYKTEDKAFIVFSEEYGIILCLKARDLIEKKELQRRFLTMEDMSITPWEYSDVISDTHVHCNNCNEVKLVLLTLTYPYTGYLQCKCGHDIVFHFDGKCYHTAPEGTDSYVLCLRDGKPSTKCMGCGDELADHCYCSKCNALNIAPEIEEEHCMPIVPEESMEQMKKDGVPTDCTHCADLREQLKILQKQVIRIVETISPSRCPCNCGYEPTINYNKGVHWFYCTSCGRSTGPQDTKAGAIDVWEYYPDNMEQEMPF